MTVVTHNPRVSVENVGSNQWKLVIKNVRKEDAGFYMAQISKLIHLVYDWLFRSRLVFELELLFLVDVMSVVVLINHFPKNDFYTNVHTDSLID